MRGFFILVLICLLITPLSANAFIFHKKDYKQLFLQQALEAEKRNNDKAAFHLYEKAIYYYKKDATVIEAYAKFCERKKYFEKAEELYQKLFILTKDEKYLFKQNLASIKNGQLPSQTLKKLSGTKSLTKSQKNTLNEALIFHFAYKQNWKEVKKTCDKIPKNAITAEVITTCIVACEKTADKKDSLGYYLRFSQLYPKDSKVLNKIATLAESFKNYPMQEKFIKKLSAQNPKDNGIKYRLAGLYEKHGDWKKAAKVYQNLLASGDESKHVKDSYAYALLQLSPKKIAKYETGTYAPKPLSRYKLDEKLFYDAWHEQKYDEALNYLGKMLLVQPNNTKLLKHKVDILMSQNNYQDAITALQNLQEVKPLSIKDEKLLAFLYSKTKNYSKAIEIIENQLQKYPDNKELLNLALEYSMAAKNWDKAITYIDTLLIYKPDSEKLLKTAGDLYSIKKDFPNAINYYKKLVNYYPKLGYKIALANFYMANKEYEDAQNILEPIYNENPDNKKITDAYLNSLLAQQKIMDAYFVIKAHHLENTKEGYIVLGDLDMRYQHYDSAGNNYFKALQFDPESIILKNKLAESYRLFGCVNSAEKIYNNILATDPENIDAKLGLGYAEIDKKNYASARQYFKNILSDNPDYKPAKIAMVHSYIANDEKFTALDTLDKIPEDNQTKLIKAQIYYGLNMPTDSKEALKNTTGKAAEALKYRIRRDNAITITPSYSALNQQLAQEFDLDYSKFGLNIAKNINRNANIFMNYNVFIYSGGHGPDTPLNTTHEFRGGAHGRPTKKFEYHTDIGVKVFEFGHGDMAVTDDWIKYYFNDKFDLKLGFYRDNLIQSFLSAVGEPVNGIFTGRVADTRTYLEYTLKFPKNFYSFGRGCYGVDYGQNLPTNQYLEGMIGFGKLLYNNPKNKWIQKINFDVVSFNSGYQYNLLDIYNSAGKLFGGYFSPSFFSANTANIKFEGEIKKWRLKYGFMGFGGAQTSRTPDFTRQAWGFAPSLSYRLNDHIDINLAYYFYNYAFMQRHLFMVNAVIRGFRKNAKN